MAKAEIIKEYSVKTLKNWLLENIERLDAELVTIEAEAERERSHGHNELVIRHIGDKRIKCDAERHTYHYCLCELQRHISQVEI